MSYNVGLLIGETTGEDAEAFAQFDSLYGTAARNGKPHPTFVALHAALTARFPCICDLPDDQIDDGVWCDGPLINNFLEQTAVVGFVYSKVDEALPFLIAEALRHGVTVFDWQDGLVHRPRP